MKKLFIFLTFIGMLIACTSKTATQPVEADSVVVDSVVVDTTVVETVDSVASDTVQ